METKGLIQVFDEKIAPPIRAVWPAQNKDQVEILKAQRQEDDEHEYELRRVEALRCIRLYREGNSCAEVGAIMGFGRVKVARILKMHNHPRRNSGEASWLWKRRIIEERDPVIHDMARRGYYLDQIADAVGLAYYSVLAILRRDGVDYKRRRDKRPKPDRDAQICELFKEGWSQEDLCEEFELSRGRIWFILNEAGLTRGKSPALDQKDEILRLRREGLTFKGIGLRLGISTDAANRVYRRFTEV